MKKPKNNLRKGLIAAALLWTSMAGAAITPEIQKKMRAATFEVVRLKPERDPLEYEKPLPMELLPYIERTDKYQSIGTAFAIGPNTFATAAHVLAACVGSQFGPPALRSADGKVYVIERIRKFSLHEDFAVFSLAGDPSAPALDVNRAPKIDETIVAVGNALGEGVVIREGLFTSETPEDQDGRWKWIRFSAAASPGNSGGPLLDNDGRVIGVVIGKSPNENLNYSLPIGRVLDAPDNVAKFEERTLSSFPYLHGTKTYSYTDEFRLPLGWSDFEKNFRDVILRHGERARSALLDDRRGKIFPDGPGTEAVFFDADVSYSPRLIMQQTNDDWIFEKPSFTKTDLPSDGYVSLGPISGALLLRLHRSDNAFSDAFYADSKAFMDIAAKALSFTRRVGPDTVRIVSFGKAQEDSVHQDRYGRRWQYRVWPVPFLDVYVVAMLLPTPEGYAGVVQYSAAQSLKDTEARIKLMANFVDVSYWGSVAQWQAFLKRRDLLPSALKDVKIELGSEWKISSARFQVGAGASAFAVDAHSELGMPLEFVRGDGKVEWGPTGIWLYRDDLKKAHATLWRQPRPPQTAKLETRNKFTNLRQRRSPYDSMPVREGSDTYSIAMAVEAPGTKPGFASSDVMYGFALQLDGHATPGNILEVQKSFSRGTRVLERGVGEDIASSVPDTGVTKRSDGFDAAAFDQWSKALDEYSNSMGRDIRGRSFREDFDQYILSDKQFAALLAEQREFGALSDETKAKAAATSADAFQRMQALDAYWRYARQVAHIDQLWGHFLVNNNLPANTAHTTRFADVKARLLKAFAHSPTMEWSELAMPFIDAANEDRKQVLNQVNTNRTIAYFPRRTDCPKAAINTSGKANPIYTGNPISLETLYPPQSKINYEEGDVILSMRVSSKGCAMSTGIAASSGSELLDAAAITWAETAEFLPAEKDGAAIDTVFKLKMKFVLKE